MTYPPLMAASKTEPKKRRGGPSGKSGANLHKVVTVRPIREGQADEWRAAAERAWLLFATWVRLTLDAAAKKQK